MCDWKPGPRCFTHYAPHYKKAQEEYQAALYIAMAEASNGGKISAATRRLLDEKFLAYMRAQQEFYTSPKARARYLGSAIEQRLKMMDAELPVDNEELRAIIQDHQRKDLDMLEKQAIDGHHRWEQAKLMSKMANDRNENALERGIFSEAAYTPEELAQVDIRQWDRACPEGEAILSGIDDNLHPSDASGVYREMSVVRKVRIETPTGERVHVDLEARIVQKTKGSSSYTVEYTIKQDGENLGILIPNSSTQDSYYNVGAVYENRPLTREPGMDYHKGIRLRKSDWDKYAQDNGLNPEELEEIKAASEQNQQILKGAAEAGETSMFSRHNAFHHQINVKHKGHKHNNTTEQFIDEHGARTSFNSIKGAKENVAQTLNSLDSTLLDIAVKGRNKGIEVYGKEQFNVSNKRARAKVEKESREIMANEPKRLQPKSRSEKRNKGGGRNRVERNLAREGRRAAHLADSSVVVSRREEAIKRNNSNMEVLQKRHGFLYSARVESNRKPTNPDKPREGYTYRVSTTQKGGNKKWASINFTNDGRLADGLTVHRHPRDPNLAAICKGNETLAVVSFSQLEAMGDVSR